MINRLIEQLNSIGINGHVSIIVSLIILAAATLFASWIANHITRHFFVKIVRGYLTNSRAKHLALLSHHNVFKKLAYFAPAIIIYLAAPLFIVETQPITLSLAHGIQLVMQAYFVFVFFIILSTLLDYTDSMYKTLHIAKKRPIKSYLQVVKILLFVLTIILIVSILLSKSPLVFLTGLGAMTAVILLIFKDSILGFVASVQISSYDMVRIGDWITLSSFGADGDVIDMSLNTIKIQNFDKTIVTVPTHALLTQGVINWRGMDESGGRRIKRAIYIDMQTIRFCTQSDLAELSKIQRLAPYIKERTDEIRQYNQSIQADKSIETNGRNLTNIGLFRSYITHYLNNHDKINPNLTFLIRQLAPTDKGLPIEIYVFTNTTNWIEYEGIQSDIFDHLLAAVPYFGLRVYQSLSDQKGLN